MSILIISTARGPAVWTALPQRTAARHAGSCFNLAVLCSNFQSILAFLGGIHKGHPTKIRTFDWAYVRMQNELRF